jgi:hypothetical protein
MEAAGIEPPRQNPRNSSGSVGSGAECGALGAREAPIDPDLALIVARWPTLPEATRKAMLVIVRGTEGKGTSLVTSMNDNF